MFEQHRSLLRAVAYRVLGRFNDAEDVVQDAWLRWDAADQQQIRDPEAFLVTVTTRLAIDRLRSAQARREEYVGPWLPEPILTSPDIAERTVLSDTVSSAMLLVLESLSPLERAVFVLREAFGYSYADIGTILDKSEASVRQTGVRAREHVQDHRRRYDTDVQTRRAAAETFLSACLGADVSALMTVLAPGVTLVSDGGGLAPAPRKAIQGVGLVANAFVTFAGRMPVDPRAVVVDVNGGPGVVVYSGDVPVAAVAFHLVDGAIETIHLVSNPEKLAGLVPHNVT